MCCHNGKCLTDEMVREYQELKSPPELLNRILKSTDKDLRREYVDNTMIFNNNFALASVHAEKADNQQNVCKYNGLSILLKFLI